MNILRLAIDEFATPFQVALLVFSVLPTAVSYAASADGVRFAFYCAATALLSVNCVITLLLWRQREATSRFLSGVVFLISLINLHFVGANVLGDAMHLPKI